ncbi:hypothetical protein AB0M44_29690 [Streptosporangium subroseum]|uniref:hypothetical protein n=1 Tax=Streptosporangium subroseum TaxID=106412 RepID=UPI003439AB88
MRGPLLLITGGRDHTVPELATRATLRRYRHPHAVTDIKNLPDRAHSLTIDGGWRMVADIALSWLRAQEFRTFSQRLPASPRVSPNGPLSPIRP